MVQPNFGIFEMALCNALNQLLFLLWWSQLLQVKIVHYNTQNNDTKHNDIQHNNTHLNDTLHNDT